MSINWLLIQDASAALTAGWPAPSVSSNSSTCWFCVVEKTQAEHFSKQEA